VVLRILQGEDDPSEMNKTFIALIPKVANPGQFRPISLCNVLHKITSKVAANRSKVILQEIILENSSSFVSLITNNLISSFECLHFMKR
jgi:hypothetical protein